MKNEEDARPRRNIARENFTIDAVQAAVRDAQRRYKMTPAEAWLAFMHAAMHELAHGCGAPNDEGFEKWLQAFVDVARNKWEEHKRGCRMPTHAANDETKH